ncbi:P97 family adhesin [Mesomycoplasma bovoculi]|uniref:p97/LppS family protein n=1 Tax=Mesomycoplasma bovoculi M165/69 TaxID=743966 RepID=W5UT03_9BACT|nr:hypothetical protein [Mesomycoplasma bovoculi]AHH45267.1 P97/LppS family protein [Mesomycoplasma bovoculi M165/69]
MKKNLKYLIIGGTAVASVVIVAAPIAATSKYTYPSDPLEAVTKDLSQITNAAFTQGTYDYKTTYADLKSKVLSKKQKDGSWNVDGLIDFFKGQQATKKDEKGYEKVSFSDAQIKVVDIKPNDEKQNFDVYFYVQSTKANDRGDFVKSSVSKATISFGYKPEFNLAAFAHDVTRKSFTGAASGQNSNGQNPNVTNSLKAYTLADVTTDRAILELTPVQDFVTDVNSATSSEDAITKLGKYFNVSSILSEINSNSENVITTNTTTPVASQTTNQPGPKATQDATTTTTNNKLRYKVSLIKNPNNNTEYITLENGGKSAKIFLQTEFSDSFKAKHQGLKGIDAKHIDILEIPLTAFADSSTPASQFAVAPTLQESDYYTTPAADSSTPSASGVATQASTSTTSTSETVKIDLKKQDPLDWIFAYNSFFFPSKAYKDAYAKLYIESSLNKPLSISDFTLNGENDTNKAIIDNKIGELKSTVKFDGDSLGLENKDGKVVATIAGTISVSSAQNTSLFTKDFTLTLDNFKEAGGSYLKTLFDEENKEKPIVIPGAQQPQQGQQQAGQQTSQTTPVFEGRLIFQKDKKFGTNALDYSAISAALQSQNPDAAKNVLADPTTTDVRFYTGERLEALTSKFVLPTDAQIASDFSLDTSKLNKKNGIFNIKSKFLPTDLSVSRYYFALANEGLDKAAPQFLKMLEAAGLVEKGKTIDVTKPIFNQLKDIAIKNVDGDAAQQTQGNVMQTQAVTTNQGSTNNPMRFFVINNENQEKGTLLHQSVLVNWSKISDITANTTTPYSKIQNTENSDYDVLKSIIDLKQADIFSNRIDKINELPSFTNAAELLIAMYTKVRLLSAPGVGFPLLPIGKGAQLSYGIGIQSDGTLANSKANNFKYQYTLKLVGDNNSEQQLYQSSEDTTTIGSVQVQGQEVSSEVQSLNQIVANIPSIYNNVWVSADEYDKLKATVDSGTPATTITNDTLSSIGLQGLSDYLSSVAPGFTISGDTTKAIVDPEGLRSYKTLNLILGKGADKATTPIRIFVYKATPKTVNSTAQQSGSSVATTSSTTSGTPSTTMTTTTSATTK